MAGYVGVDPSALAAVAGLLDDAALELRGCAALVAEAGAESTERSWVLSVAEWSEGEANDLRKRASVERALGLAAPFGGAQHGKGNKKHSDEEIARLRALLADKTIPRKVRTAAEEKIKEDAKGRRRRGSRYSGDTKKFSETQPPNIDPEKMKHGAEMGAALGGAAATLWWLGKLASPACGPAAPACALLL
jgi:hypothetical protein